MSDLTDLQDQTLLDEIRADNDRAALNLNSCNPHTLRDVLEAMRMYSHYRMPGYEEEYSELMGAIARKLNTEVWK